MNSLLQALEANEPTISAAVGLLTLAAACWGAIQLALLPMLAALSTDETPDQEAGSPSKKFKLWASLVDRGVDPRADLMDQISARTLNASLLSLIATTLLLTLAALLIDEVVVMSVINLALFLTTIAAYNLQAAGLRTLARWTLIVSLTVYWTLNIVLMGPGIGLEYCLGGLLLLPLLLFEKTQNRQMWGASAMILLSLPAALAVEVRLRDTWPFNALDAPAGYYYGNAVVLAALVYLALYFFNRSADSSFKQLEDQEQKSAELLHSMLPAYIAEKVVKRGSAVADWHSEASVLFATVTGFETLYKRVSAVQLVEIVKQVFEEFDQLVDERNVEKINTLGTHYVAATGLDPTRVASCAMLAHVALGMRETIKGLSANLDHQFGVRIGISTGDVLSGVIGSAQPSLDIWGSTVELANTMRNDAITDTIVVNEAAYWRLKKAFSFERHRSDENRFLLLGPLSRDRLPRQTPLSSSPP